MLATKPIRDQYLLSGSILLRLIGEIEVTPTTDQHFSADIAI